MSSLQEVFETMPKFEAYQKSNLFSQCFSSTIQSVIVAIKFVFFLLQVSIAKVLFCF